MQRTSTPLAPHDRRALFLGIALVAGAWLVTRGVPAGLRAHQVARARTEAAVLDVARARALLEAEPAMRESLAARGRRLVDWAPRLIPGETLPTAGAELAALVGGLAGANRVRVVRLDAMPDSATGMFARVAVRVEATSDISGLAGWLTALEAGDRLIVVREMEIGAPEPAAAPGQVEALRVQLVIEGTAAPRARGMD